MFLRSLTVRGFKSFAETTTLEVEHGVTVIVGPNGSGKSNVVDALAFLLGTHAPTRVRSSQMADVIFAGSPTRAPLGRARVEITIDNTRGQLGHAGFGTARSAREFRTVRVGREIFPTGESVYTINGEECRALDVQELLSDAGLGRQMHTIVGQGQLDEILAARPEERRSFVEEAAGITKHRRRRERAVRKLEQVDVHIDRLRGLLRELRRQLAPLERQAEAADRHRRLQAELRGVRLRLAAHDLATLIRRLDDRRADDEAAAARERDAEQALEGARAAVTELQKALDGDQPAAEAAQQRVFRLASLRERLRGTAELIEAKRRHLVEAVEEPLAGRPPEDLRSQADDLDAVRARRQEDRQRARAALQETVSARREAERARRAHEQELAAEARRRSEQRERVLRWEGEVSALRGSVASTEAEVGRAAAQLQGLDDRIAEATADADKVQAEIQRLDADEVELAAALEAAEQEVEAADRRLGREVAAERDLERVRASEAARAEALRAALAERDAGARSLLDADLEGIVGMLADHVTIKPGGEAAVAAALGTLGEAVLVASAEQGRRAIAWLREVEGGRATVLSARGPAPAAPGLDDDVRERLEVAEARPVSDLLDIRGDGAEEALRALRAVLARTFVVSSWNDAVLLHGRNPELTFVTSRGDVAGPSGYVGGSSPRTSAVTTAAAVEESERRVAGHERRLREARDRVAQAEADSAQARAVLEEAAGRLNESDALITGAAERLARLNKELHALRNQRELVGAQHAELQELLARDKASLEALLARGPEVPEVPEPAGVQAGDEHDRLDAAVEEARGRELDARVELERIEERLRYLEVQASDLRDEADEVERRLREAAARRERRRQAIDRCGDLTAVCRLALEVLERSVERAEHERERLRGVVEERRQALQDARERVSELAGELDGLREQRHTSELRRSEVEHRRDQLVERVRDEFALEPDALVAEHPDASTYDREELTGREDVLHRKIGMLGRVNPLALEEFKALEQRHAFLAGQLDDLRRSRRDLKQVIGAVDDRIRDVFGEAFEDVAAEFETLFARLFGGGRGRLVLTDPDDLLHTGVEVEARPPGKRVKLLSLLSGGERSLAALAFVLAIFRARPSPFYVLDEVDAALDDVNLQRLLEVLEGFREQAQLIVVTHQKRTMELADVLYGVTIGSDGVSTVVADRPAEPVVAGT